MVLVRGQLSDALVRQDDTLASCPRNGDPANPPCGFYFPVTDNLGTPVAMLDNQAKLTAVEDMDAWGYPNRGELAAQTAHP